MHIFTKAMLTAPNEDSREALRSLLSACTHRQVAKVQITGVAPRPLSEEEKWCMYIRYHHEEKMAGLIEQLCREELETIQGLNA